MLFLPFAAVLAACVIRWARDDAAPDRPAAPGPAPASPNAAPPPPTATPTAPDPAPPKPAPPSTPQPAEAAPARRGKPNIILIIGDDHGYPHYGFMKHPVIKTPAMDKMAADGALFPVCHNCSPVCWPSLESMLTGLNPKDFTRDREVALTGERDAPAGKGKHEAASLTLPNALRKAGYRSFGFGKFWSGFKNRGFDEFVERSKGSAGRKTMQPIYDFVDNHRKEYPDRPFFVWYAPRLPHVPHTAPDRFRQLYAGRNLDNETLAYYATITWMDDTVRDLCDNLRQRKILQDCLLIYVADNGYGLPRAKHCYTENGYRTVLWAWLPGSVKPGQVRDEMTHTIDLLPTCLDYAGLEIPRHLEGRSLRPLLEGRTVPWRKYLFGQEGPDGSRTATPPRSCYLRTQDGLKYYSPRNALYDLNADPDETKNLAGDPKYAERIAEWRRAIQAWGQRTGDHDPSALPEKPAGR